MFTCACPAVQSSVREGGYCLLRLIPHCPPSALPSHLPPHHFQLRTTVLWDLATSNTFNTQRRTTVFVATSNTFNTQRRTTVFVATSNTFNSQR